MPFSFFVLNGLVLSLLILKSLFCPVLCPFCPSHKRLEFARTVLFLLRSRTVNITKRVCRDCPIPNCGAKYLVRLSNHLTDVHGLDYINRRKWSQEAKLQPKDRVMIYPAKRSQGLRPRNKWNTSISARRGKGYNSPSFINTKRSKEIPEISTKRTKKSLKSLTKGFRKAANNIKHCKTTADSVPEWLTFYGDDEGSNTEKRA